MPKTKMELEFIPRRRGLGYTENHIASEQDAVKQLFSKGSKKTRLAMQEIPEDTKLHAVKKRKSQASWTFFE